MDVDTLVQQKLDADTDFAASIADMSDDDKTAATETKRKELRNAEFKALSDGKTKAEEIAENQKKRAEKAEGKVKKDPADGGGSGDEDKDFSSTDTIALIDAKVTHPEDLAEVKKSSKLLGKSISETLKDKVVIGILAQNAEHRKAADAAQTKVVRPGNKGKSDQEIIDDTNKGHVPAKGSQDAEDLFWAKRGGRRK